MLTLDSLASPISQYCESPGIRVAEREAQPFGRMVTFCTALSSDCSRSRARKGSSENGADGGGGGAERDLAHCEVDVHVGIAKIRERSDLSKNVGLRVKRPS